MSNKEADSLVTPSFRTKNLSFDGLSDPKKIKTTNDTHNLRLIAPIAVTDWHPKSCARLPVCES